jgi:hypothetical protein
MSVSALEYLGEMVIDCSLFQESWQGMRMRQVPSNVHDDLVLV